MESRRKRPYTEPDNGSSILSAQYYMPWLLRISPRTFSQFGDAKNSTGIVCISSELWPFHNLAKEGNSLASNKIKLNPTKKNHICSLNVGPVQCFSNLACWLWNSGSLRSTHLKVDKFEKIWSNSFFFLDKDFFFQTIYLFHLQTTIFRKLLEGICQSFSQKTWLQVLPM